MIVTRSTRRDHPVLARWAGNDPNAILQRLTPESLDPKHLPPVGTPLVLVDLTENDLAQLLPILVAGSVKRTIHLCDDAPTRRVRELCFLHAVSGPWRGDDLANMPWELCCAVDRESEPTPATAHDLLRALDHHVRNRLCTIQQAAYLAADDARLGQEAWSHLKRVELASTDIEHAIARIEELTVPLPRDATTVDLRSILESTRRTLRDEARIEMTFSYPPPSRCIPGPERIVVQLLVELAHHLVHVVCHGRGERIIIDAENEESLTSCMIRCRHERGEAPAQPSWNAVFVGIEARFELCLPIARRLAEHLGATLDHVAWDEGSCFRICMPSR